MAIIYLIPFIVFQAVNCGSVAGFVGTPTYAADGSSNFYDRPGRLGQKP